MSVVCVHQHAMSVVCVHQHTVCVICVHQHTGCVVCVHQHTVCVVCVHLQLTDCQVRSRAAPVCLDSSGKEKKPAVYTCHGLGINQVNIPQGPYAWVQGRRAISKVTATSGDRLTNRYAGRPTRRACLGVNLPLRVPPCKHYPEEVTELKIGRSYSATLPPETTTLKKSDFSGQDKPFTQI